MGPSADFLDYYELLDVPRDAGDDEIKTAIRVKRKKWRGAQNHPNADTRSLAEKNIAHISAAEPILLDLTRRQRYDQELRDHLDHLRLRADESRQPAPATVPAGRDFLKEAKEHLRNGRAFEANYAAREAIHANSADPAAWYVRSRSSLQLGKLGEAQVEVGNAIREGGNRAEFHGLLGEIFASSGSWNDALAAYQYAGQLDPGTMSYPIGRAAVLARTGRSREAVPILEGVVAQYPGDIRAQEVLATALLDGARSQWSITASGQRIITNPAQIEATAEVLRRVVQLTINDAEVQWDIDDVAQTLATAETVSWYRSENRRTYLICFGIAVLVVLSSIGSNPGLGLFFLIVAALIAFIYTRRHHLPQWKFNAKIQPPEVLRSGMH